MRSTTYSPRTYRVPTSQVRSDRPHLQSLGTHPDTIVHRITRSVDDYRLRRIGMSSRKQEIIAETSHLHPGLQVPQPRMLHALICEAKQASATHHKEMKQEKIADNPNDKHKDSQLPSYNLSPGTAITCVWILDASTISGTTSLIVLAPRRRRFISNSS